MKGILKNLAIITILFLSSISYAQDAQNCGLENGKVVPSADICPEDKAAHFLHVKFPQQMEEFILPLVLEYPVKVFMESTISSSNTGMEQLASNISMVLRFIIIYFAVSHMLRGLFVVQAGFVVEGKFPEELSKVSFFMQAIGILLLVPYGNFMLIQNLFLFVKIAGIMISNYLFSLFISAFQEIQIAGVDKTEQYEEVIKVKEGAFFHNESYAYGYVESLVKMNLCKTQTTMYRNIVQVERVNSFNNGSIQDEFYIENDKRLINSNFNEESFVNITDKIVSKDNRIVDGIIFAKPTSEKKTKNEYDFTCGSISSSLTNIENTELEKVVVKAGLYDFVEETVSQFKNSDPVSIHNATLSGARSLREAVLGEMGIDNIKMANDEHKQIAKQASLVYHQHIMSALLVGYGVNKRGRLINDHSYVLNETIDKAEVLANKIRERECLDGKQKELVRQSLIAFNILQGNGMRRGSGTACLDVTDKGVVGVLGSVNNEKMYKDPAALILKRNKVENEIKNLKSDLISDVRELRTAVEKSYLLDIFAIDDKTPYYSEIRKGGYLNYGNEALNIINSVSKNRTSSLALRNTVSTDTNNLYGDYVQLDGNAQVESGFPNFDRQMGMVFQGMRIDVSSIQEVDFQAYIETLVKDQSSQSISAIDFEANLKRLLLSPAENFNKTYDLDQNCNGEYLCEAKTNNPLLNLIVFSDDLIAVGSAIIAADFILSFQKSKKDRKKGRFNKGKYRNRTKSFSKSVAATTAATLQAIINPVVPYGWMMLSAGISIKFLGYVFSLLFIMSNTIFEIYYYFFFMIIGFVTLRFIKFSSLHEIGETFKFVSQIAITFALYIPLVILGSIAFLMLFTVAFILTSKIILNMIGVMSISSSGIIEILLTAIGCLIGSVIMLMMTWNILKKSNDLPHLTKNSFMNFESQEQTLAQGMKAGAVGLTVAAQNFGNKQKNKIKKLRQEQEKKKDNKNKGKS